MSCSTSKHFSQTGSTSGSRPADVLPGAVFNVEQHVGQSAGSCARRASALECWNSIAAVDDFASCDPSQYIRVFPRLVAKVGTVPVALRAHITRCLAVLAWRSMANGDETSMRVLCGASRVTFIEMANLGAREHGFWFADTGPRGLAVPATQRSALGEEIDAGGAFALVNTLNREIDQENLRHFAIDDAALFAFTAGVHPAYLWPEALLSHEFYTAVGWLGHLWRRRRADMTGDLAEYFDDLLDVGDDGLPSTRDPQLARFLPCPEVLAEVHRAVRVRRGGRPSVAVWPGLAPRSPAASLRPQTPKREDGGPSS